MDFVFLLLVLAGGAAFVVFASARIVTQGHEFTLERFGRYTRILPPGLHLIIPFAERIGMRMNVQEQVLELPAQQVMTRDNTQVRVDGVVFFQVQDAARAAYQVNNLVLAILNLTMTNLRVVMRSMDLDELLSGREQINLRLLQIVDDATQPWGVKITRIEIRDISPPAEIIQAMARRTAVAYEMAAHILEAEGHRQAQVLKAEGSREAASRDHPDDTQVWALDGEIKPSRPLPPGIKRRTGGWPEGSLPD